MAIIIAQLSKWPDLWFVLSGSKGHAGNQVYECLIRLPLEIQWNIRQAQQHDEEESGRAYQVRHRQMQNRSLFWTWAIPLWLSWPVTWLQLTIGLMCQSRITQMSWLPAWQLKSHDLMGALRSKWHLKNNVLLHCGIAFSEKHAVLLISFLKGIFIILLSFGRSFGVLNRWPLSLSCFLLSVWSKSLSFISVPAVAGCPI